MSTKLVKNSQKKQQESTAAEVLQNLLEYLTVLFGIIMAGVLVFYMQEGYVKIGTAKFNVYAHVCVFGMPLLLLLAIFWLYGKAGKTEKIQAAFFDNGSFSAGISFTGADQFLCKRRSESLLLGV